MATSSIFANIVIRDRESAESLVNALESSEKDAKEKASIERKTPLTDIQAIRNLMARRGKKGE